MNLKESVRNNVILSYYDFIMKVAMAWINPELYWTTEENGPATISWRKRKSTVLVASAATAEMNETKRLRTNQIKDDSLYVHGSLFIRLNTSEVHLPDEAKGEARYSLHKWLEIDTQKGIAMCKSCNVNLCKACFKLFHTEHDLVRMKKTLNLKYSNNTRKNTNK